ncbi:hypothetical protein Kpol_472p10 [Vanderwaltozyma polyspora DSM 70294]|uniref:C2H2-type domain-containing protein n=1 Tax=Vanderwaltozyma polyspora (strain ATCC 22028 / DSM 70294 / BCRC 21397 / CBS 2163 / NBRC 10782 / NRRL Y-8283 / UCD 57-17) TaxID=436907 RepID=A7TQH8_VANPO|nr:uncharacterized protein Kpol_472p10 [Vanderwaltozyma polyspora DSM 70294]EDO15479.1 hypothetical protein Kpol_472p10 [Vanderwaltozyma polyspora DSM 70294]
MKSSTNWKHICSYCNRAFSRSEHKARHERSHTGTKPYECKVCLREFVRRDLLQRHIRTVHKSLLLSKASKRQDHGNNNNISSSNNNNDDSVKEKSNDNNSNNSKEDLSAISEKMVNSLNKRNFSNSNLITLKFQPYGSKGYNEIISPSLSKNKSFKRKSYLVELQRCITMNNERLQVPIDSLSTFYDRGLTELMNSLPNHNFNVNSKEIVFVLICIGSMITYDPQFNDIWNVTWYSFLISDVKDAQPNKNFIPMTVLLYLTLSIEFSLNICDETKSKIAYTEYYKRLTYSISNNQTYNAEELELMLHIFSKLIRILDVRTNDDSNSQILYIYNWFMNQKLSDNGETLIYYMKHFLSISNVVLPIRTLNLLTDAFYCEFLLQYPNFQNIIEYNTSIILLLKMHIHLINGQKSNIQLESSIEKFFSTLSIKTISQRFWVLLEICWLDFLKYYSILSNSTPDSNWLLFKSPEELSLYESIDIGKLTDNFIIPTLVVLSIFNSQEKNFITERMLPLVMDVIEFQVKLFASEINKIANGIDLTVSLNDCTLKLLFSAWTNILYQERTNNGEKDSDELLIVGNFVTTFIQNSFNGKTMNHANASLSYHYFIRAIMKNLKANILMDKLITSNNEFTQESKSILIRIWENLQSIIKQYWNPPIIPPSVDANVIIEKERTLSSPTASNAEDFEPKSIKIILPLPTAMNLEPSGSQSTYIPSINHVPQLQSVGMGYGQSSNSLSVNSNSLIRSTSFLGNPLTPVSMEKQQISMFDSEANKSVTNGLSINYTGNQSNQFQYLNINNSINTNSTSIPASVGHNNNQNGRLPSTTELFGDCIE